MLTDRPSRSYFGTFAILREPTPNNELIQMSKPLDLIVKKVRIYTVGLENKLRVDGCGTRFDSVGETFSSQSSDQL